VTGSKRYHRRLFTTLLSEIKNAAFA